MLNANRVTELKEQLAVAEHDAKPVIVEKTEDSKDQTVYINRTSGTVRVDRKGGETQYVEQPVVEEVSLTLRPVPKEVGKVIKENEDERVVKLVSGSIRTEMK